MVTELFDLEVMEQLHRQIHKKYLAEWSAISPLNLTLPQANMLYKLQKEGIQRVTDLAELLCMTPGSLTLLCDKLEEKKLILRYRDEVDRRSVYLEISEEGEKAVSSIKELKAELFKKMMQGVSAEDLQVLKKIFNSFLRNLE
ncbi:MarR family winged helix-turn-helix transcriptional regulator [Paenibacillus agricola]|uniref:MarR family transcriptional regulator n=1 Tax=Paenibacillus agricola TaxID=2716264 RepID=A0ABX0J670_9BACL|nr:MarR family transcriptional regulator [Paenibacillus agricola]NHN30328.1 MarR family transcriptional regulator [Paenibacillus agricola]